ncbi:metallophosphoesterase family protein [Marinobacter adhaerens]|uniref:metallophosphoesterase family protein n=1 Tax=Marinobacter adhaerens TaxID=1033846 RepID=UPI003D0AB096
MDMWNAQKKWLAEKLEASTAEWQIVVTHYPPTFEPCRSELWASYFGKYGIDLYISGHTHLQETHYKTGDFGDTAYVISGGGGGITSEIIPSKTGDDDAYGFMDVIINHDVINIIRYSHGGVDKKTIIRGQTQASSDKRTACIGVPLAIPKLTYNLRWYGLRRDEKGGLSSTFQPHKRLSQVLRETSSLDHGLHRCVHICPRFFSQLSWPLARLFSFAGLPTWPKRSAGGGVREVEG